MAVYYAGGIAFAAVAAHRVADGGSFGSAVAAFEPWQALVLVPAALAVAVGFGAYGRAAWRATAAYRAEGRRWLRRAPSAYAGRIPKRVRRRRPAAVAVYEVPMGLLGFPGLGWLFAGYPLAGSTLLLIGPAIAWAAIPLAFTPFANGPLRPVGWQAEWIWLPASTLVSTVLLYLAHRRRRLRLLGSPPRRGRSRRSYRTRVAVVGRRNRRCSSWPSRLCLLSQGSAARPSATPTRPDSRVRSPASSCVTPRGTIKLFAWSDPQSTFPADALRVHASDLRALRVRAAAVDRAPAYQLFDLDGKAVPLVVRQSSRKSSSSCPDSNSPLAATSSRRVTKACSGAATSRMSESSRRASR